MDKPLLRKGKTTHGSKLLDFEGFGRIRTKSGEFWVLRGWCEVTTFCSQLGKSWVELGNGWERYDN